MARRTVERASPAAAGRAHWTSAGEAPICVRRRRGRTNIANVRRRGPRPRPGPDPRPAKPSRRPAGFLVSKRPPLSARAPPIPCPWHVGPIASSYPASGVRPLAGRNQVVPGWQIACHDDRDMAGRLPSGRTWARVSAHRSHHALPRLAEVAHRFCRILGASRFGDAKTKRIERIDGLQWRNTEANCCVPKPAASAAPGPTPAGPGSTRGHAGRLGERADCPAMLTRPPDVGTLQGYNEAKPSPSRNPASRSLRLTQVEQRALIRAALAKHPLLPDLRIARAVGCAASTVARVREAAGVPPYRRHRDRRPSTAIQVTKRLLREQIETLSRRLAEERELRLKVEQVLADYLAHGASETQPAAASSPLPAIQVLPAPPRDPAMARPAQVPTHGRGLPAAAWCEECGDTRVLDGP